MSRFLLSLTLLSISLLGIAQSPKQKIVDRTSDAMTMGNSALLNNKLFTIGRSEYSAMNRVYPTLTVQDLDLDVIYITLPHLGPDYIDRYEVLWNVVKTSDNKLLLSGTNGELGNSAMFYFKMDENYNILWYKEIRTATSGNQFAYGSVANSVGGALIVGTENGGSPTNEVQLVNIDSNGDTLWTRKVTATDGANMSGGVDGVYIDQSDNFVTVLRHGNGFDVEMLSLDQNGNMVENFQYVDTDGYMLNVTGIVYANDANYYCGRKGGGNFEGVVIKTDLNGNVIWGNKYLGTADFSKIHLSSNGELILYGNPTWGDNINKTEVLKLDTDGNVVKAYSYGKLPDRNGLSSNILEINGHFYISGRRQYQTASTGFQLCLDDDLSSNSCYQSEFSVSSSNISYSKVSVNTSIVSSMKPDILAYGTPVGSMIITITPFVDYSLNNSIINVLEESDDNCGGLCIGTAEVSSTVGGTSPYDYLWSNGQTGPFANGLCVDDEVVLVTSDQFDCFIQDTVVVERSAPVNDLCLVTVDSTSTKNEVVWEKPISGAIEGFVVHREVVGNYTVVGYVPYDSLSQFIDNTNGVNPNITSYRYKITTIDTCGNESEYSDYHETIHLTVNQGAGIQTNLIWDGYEGFSFSYNRIWKDSLGDDNWVLRDSVSSSVFTWTDIYASTVATEYLIEVVSPSICTAAKAQDYGSTRSNKSTIAGPPAELGLEEMAAIDFTVFPNPSGSFFTLKHNSIDKMNLFIYDNQGRLVKSFGINDLTTIIEIPDLEAGMYLLRFGTGDNQLTKQLIKE
ncbi:MAG: T9SS type A sorting domain-containing protein [Flavobacteriales bacterium]|nr:T9SS type A sorting domain-containing protein [Flavobacteriales bacterium]MCB9197688.1 T9SS type A sorting domain-containing protein [Flavobacteriales bacterium]